MYLGVDGGGTLTRALIVDEEGRAIGVGQAGPANIHQVDRKTVRKNFHKAISSALLEVGEGDYSLTSACFGLAGSSAPESKERLMSVINSLPYIQGVNVKLMTDAEIALRGGLIDEPGLLLIAGTGSVCMGRNSEGELIRTGGWGVLADDAGSGLWIGRKAIEIAVRQADGRLSEGDLGNAVFEELGIASMDQIVSVLHSSALSKAKIAQLALLVTRFAENGDEVSLHLVDQAISEIVALLRATLTKAGLQHSDVITVGGLVAPGTWFRKRLDSVVARELAGTVLRSPRLSPVSGAIIEALRLDGEELDSGFYENVETASRFFMK